MWKAISRALRLTTLPERVARAAFRQAHPGTRVVRTTLAADEEHRFVVGVFYDWGGKPTRFRYYAVAKVTRIAAPLEDDAAYRPKVWR